MKLIPLALLLVLAVAVSAQIGPEKDYHFQDGSCSRNNNNCDWIIGHWSGFVTSSATSLRFFNLPDRDVQLVNTPWAQELNDLWCTERQYEIPYDCTFGYSEQDDNLYQYCWFEGVHVPICSNEVNDYVNNFDGNVWSFESSGFSTPAFFMTNRISSLQGGITYTNLETSVSHCLPYDVASKDLIIGNLWDGFSDIGACSTSSDDFGPSPVLPASCTEFFTTTTTPSTTSTTTPSTTSTTTTTPTTSTTTTSTTTTSTTTTSTTTSSTTTTSTTTTPPTTTTTTTTSGTTTTSTNPGAEYGCSLIYNGIDAVYGFELARVRPASFPKQHIDDSNRRCDGSKDHNCVCERQSSSCNWLVGLWDGVLYAKGYNSFEDDGDYDDNDNPNPVYPFPLFEEDVRCQWSESATPFQCAYYFNEETDFLNSHCWYEATSGYVNVGSGSFQTYGWEQWSEIASLNNGVVVSDSSATFLDTAAGDECIPMDRFDSDTFLMQFPDGFSNTPACGDNISPVTTFDCVDGWSSVDGNNNMFTINHRHMDASWHDWDASSSLTPLIALSILLAALLALF